MNSNSDEQKPLTPNPASAKQTPLPSVAAEAVTGKKPLAASASGFAPSKPPGAATPEGRPSLDSWGTGRPRPAVVKPGSAQEWGNESIKGGPLAGPPAPGQGAIPATPLAATPSHAGSTGHAKPSSGKAQSPSHHAGHASKAPPAKSKSGGVLSRGKGSRIVSHDTTIEVISRRPVGPNPLAQATRPLAIATPLGEDVLALRAMHGREELGRLSQFDVELLSQDYEIPFNKIIGENVTIRLNQTNGIRYWNGYVSHFTQLAPTDRYARYRATIVPWLWFLTRTQDCQIYQNQTVPQIIELVFKKYGFDAYLPRLTGKYQPREYCVQYRETAFNFLSRLMEQEGIYYYFEHENGKHTLMLVDSLSTHRPVPGYETIKFRPPDETSKSGEHIRDWTINGELLTGRYVHTDYNFLIPRTSLEARIALERDHRAANFEVFDYPGAYQKHDEGDRYAHIRIEEIQCRHDIQIGEADARGLCAGHTFKLDDFKRRDQNRGYLIVSTTHNLESDFFESTAGGQTEPLCRCSFSVVSSDVQYRAESSTPKPIVHGSQTAVVVGPKGQEIYVDDNARVKVQFFWDRYGKSDENSSCWLRVSQPWAGKGYGGMNIPRICCEVIVDFLEGDPDRPIITGRVYNAGTMPHASNSGRDGKPGNTKPSGIGQAGMVTSFASQSTPGGGGSNEITMNDAKGAEGLFIKAQKDEIHNVGNDRERTVGNNEAVKVGNNRAKTVGTNETAQIGVDQSIAIGSNQSVQIGANRQETVAANDSLQVGSAKVIDVGTTLLIKAGTAITLQCGASTIHMNQAGFITISGTVISVAGAVMCNMAAPIVSLTGAVALMGTGGVLNLQTGGVANASLAGANHTILSGGKTSMTGATAVVHGSVKAQVIGGAGTDIIGGVVKIN